MQMTPAVASVKHRAATLTVPRSGGRVLGVAPITYAGYGDLCNASFSRFMIFDMPGSGVSDPVARPVTPMDAYRGLPRTSPGHVVHGTGW